MMLNFYDLISIVMSEVPTIALKGEKRVIHSRRTKLFRASMELNKYIIHLLSDFLKEVRLSLIQESSLLQTIHLMAVLKMTFQSLMWFRLIYKKVYNYLE